LGYTKDIPVLETYPYDYVSVGRDDASGDAGGASRVAEECCLTLGLAFAPPGCFQFRQSPSFVNKLGE